VFPGRRLPYALVAPQVTLILVFFVWPALQSLHLALYRVSPFGDRRVFVGADNFLALLRSADYRRSLAATGLFALGVTAGGLVVSLGLALLVNRARRARSLLRAALLWPYGLAPAVAGVIWLLIFHPGYGLAPAALGAVIPVTRDWHLQGWVAMLLLMGAAIWTKLGYNVAIFLAGLQTIPASVLEAARVDGAGTPDRFWRIVFPLLSPVTFFLVVMNTVFAFFETFGLVHTLTQGGPGRSTEILAYKAYRDGFVNQQPGSSAAQSVVLMLIVIVLTVAQFRLSERKVVY
jgi:sn-glycerol 3-phosphate transport system permease protein